MVRFIYLQLLLHIVYTVALPLFWIDMTKPKDAASNQVLEGQIVKNH